MVTLFISKLDVLKRARVFRQIAKIKNAVVLLFFMLITHPVWADLPKPPDKDIANGTNDWADVGSTLIYKILSYSCMIIGVVIVLGVAVTIIKSFHVAHEKQDLGHFFKTLVVGLIAASIGAGLVYAGYQIIPQSSG